MAQLVIQIEKLMWKELINQYLKEILSLFEDRLVGFYASYDPNVTVYDYNVIIVVKDIPTDKDIEEVRAIARNIEEEAGLDTLIIPIVVEKGDIIEDEAYATFNHGT